jgi:hypothetical protein
MEYGPVRSTKIALRRHAYLQGVQLQAAWEAVRGFQVSADSAETNPDTVALDVIARVMNDAKTLTKAADLGDMGAESYVNAVRKGCDRLLVGIKEAKAAGQENQRPTLMSAVEGIAVRDIARWHVIGPE